MSVSRFFRRITGTEPDYWDFQVIDLESWKHYVFFNGISPNEETVHLRIGALERKGVGVWFLDVEPKPINRNFDAVLLFMDSKFNWHQSVLQGAEGRYIALGIVRWDYVKEGGFEGEKSTSRIASILRRKEGTQYVLVAEIIPISPDSDELLRWYEAARAKIDFNMMNQLAARVTRLASENESLRIQNTALIEENQMLKARVSVLLSELNRLKQAYPDLMIAESIGKLLAEQEIRRVEQMEEEIYGKPTIWDLVLRRERKTSEELRERQREFDKEIEELKKKLKEGEEL
ncbi:MAG: hypothetical protein QXP84_07450 [Candidatus Korarchaeum sp.]